jgi:hypothetical protein
MAEGAYGKMGAPRVFALWFGIVFVGVAILELFFPRSDPLTAGTFVVLQRTTLLNVLHFAAGFVVLGSFFAGEGPAVMVARVVGVLFLGLTIWGFVSPAGLGGFFGFDGEIPVIYNIVHAATAVLALIAGFAPRPARSARAR